MASSVDICNAALSHLGARAQVAAISPPDGSVEAGYCARFYPLARRELIEAHNWSWSLARTTLAEITNVSDVWLYAYTLPSDCITPLRVLIGGQGNEHDGADFAVEDGVLRTNEPAAVLLYKRDVTDASRFTPTFVTALGMLLAGYLAGPIIKGLDGAKVGAQWRDASDDLMKRAAARDANGSEETDPVAASHLTARA